MRGWQSVAAGILLGVPVLGGSLQLHFQDEGGAPVEIELAELLVAAWGETDRIELATGGDSLRIPTDADWLPARWQRAATDYHFVYLHLRAPGFAPIRSHRFPWPGSESADGVVTVRFPHGNEAALAEGVDAEVVVPFRRPIKRRLHLVDREGTAASDIGLKGYMYWSAENHCGVLDGADPLGTFVTDEGGIIEVPDGDFEYVFELLSRTRASFDAGNSVFQNRLRIYLTEPVTQVVLHRWQPQTLELRVVRGTRPLPRMALVARVPACCGACEGIIGVSDAGGGVIVRDFYREAWEQLYLIEAEPGHGPGRGIQVWPRKALWQADTRDLPTKLAPIDIDLTQAPAEIRPPPGVRAR